MQKTGSSSSELKTFFFQKNSHPELSDVISSVIQAPLRDTKLFEWKISQNTVKIFEMLQKVLILPFLFWFNIKNIVQILYLS